MSMIDDMRRRLAGRAAAPPAAQIEDDATRELRERRDDLAARVAELTFDLGGLTYEMAIRDHIRPDVLVRRAAALQEADAELAEAERLLRLGETGTSGSCRACGALHSRGASFCWQCGTPLLERVSAP
jgi:C4-dicarboxylate-specific signal transduction histidine kinase